MVRGDTNQGGVEHWQLAATPADYIYSSAA